METTMSLNERVDLLEQQLEKKQSLVGPQGARGPAGNIDAAVAAMESVVEKNVQKLEKQHADVVARLEEKNDNQIASAIENIQSEIESLRQKLREEIETAVASALVNLLIEYRMLSKDGVPFQTQHFAEAVKKVVGK